MKKKRMNVASEYKKENTAVVQKEEPPRKPTIIHKSSRFCGDYLQGGGMPL